MVRQSREYKLSGRFQYGVYISEFDGWDYKFPILDPIRLENIMERVNAQPVPRATDFNWLEVQITAKQKRSHNKWVPEDDFVLHMRPVNSSLEHPYAYVGRFSYEPESKEFLMGRLNEKHAETIHRFGKHRFNEYVRGIYLRDMRMILIRAYFNPLDMHGIYNEDAEFEPEVDKAKTDKTLEMLIKNNMPKNIAVIVRVDNEAIKKFEDVHI